MTSEAGEISQLPMSTSIGARLRRLTMHEFSWIWLGTALLFGVSAVIAPGTVRAGAIASMMPFAAILAIAAVGQTIVIQQRGLDMSLPAIMTLCGLLLAKLGFWTESMPIAIAITLAIAVLCGIVNGLLVSKLNITPIVATLATNAVLLGMVRMISGGVFSSAPPELAAFSRAYIFGVPATLVLALAFIIFVNLVTKRTLVGRQFVAVGANPEAAAAAGIPVLPYQVSTYAVAAVCFAVAGMLFTGFIGTASQTAGNDYLLPAIAAVVVGGTPFSGGRGSVIASGVAALFMVQLGQMVLALGASTSVQLLVQALAIVLAVTIRHVPNILRVLGLLRQH